MPTRILLSESDHAISVDPFAIGVSARIGDSTRERRTVTFEQDRLVPGASNDGDSLQTLNDLDASMVGHHEDVGDDERELRWGELLHRAVDGFANFGDVVPSRGG